MYGLFTTSEWTNRLKIVLDKECGCIYVWSWQDCSWGQKALMIAGTELATKTGRTRGTLRFELHTSIRSGDASENCALTVNVFLLCMARSIELDE